MSTLLICYQPKDPLAQSFQLQLQKWADDNWDFPAIRFQKQEADVPLTRRQIALKKRQLRQVIRQAHQVLFVISRDSWQSEWVDWEISTALQEDKQLLAAKMDTPNIAPLGLLNANPQWIDPFDPWALSQRHI